MWEFLNTTGATLVILIFSPLIIVGILGVIFWDQIYKIIKKDDD